MITEYFVAGDINYVTIGNLLTIKTITGGKIQIFKKSLIDNLNLLLPTKHYDSRMFQNQDAPDSFKKYKANTTPKKMIL